MDDIVRFFLECLIMYLLLSTLMAYGILSWVLHREQLKKEKEKRQITWRDFLKIFLIIPYYFYMMAMWPKYAYQFIRQKCFKI